MGFVAVTFFTFDELLAIAGGTARKIPTTPSTTTRLIMTRAYPNRGFQHNRLEHEELDAAADIQLHAGDVVREV